jgi:hypothetical protein
VNPKNYFLRIFLKKFLRKKENQKRKKKKNQSKKNNINFFEFIKKQFKFSFLVKILNLKIY